MTWRILYVDDEADIREVAAMALELDPDFEIRTCDSGAEALEVARQWRPHLILLDFMMPLMDGPATLAALRADPDGRTTPVVFVTARTHRRDVDYLHGLGAAGVIAKPFDPMLLAALVREHLPA